MIADSTGPPPMKLPLVLPLPRLLAWPLLCGCLAAAQAQETPIPLSPDSSRVWDAALGMNLSRGPAYLGSSETKTRLTPGFFVRYGRFSLTNSSGFATRRADDVVRGLGVDLSRSERVKISLGLRFDGGRSEGDSEALRGLGDVKSTVRARVGLTWKLDERWRLGAAWTIDAFGRGGGNYADFSLTQEHRWSPSTTWSWGGAFTVAGTRYMQSYFGITAEQAARSGLREYHPATGLRDASLYASMRSELGDHWVGLAGIGFSRVLGPAADSPLTTRQNNVGVNAGLAWRF